jgi:hypothetical protein
MGRMTRTLPLDVVMAAIPRTESTLRAKIQVLLAEQEPRTVAEVNAALGNGHAHMVLQKMAEAGELVRARLGGQCFWYARSASVLAHAPLAAEGRPLNGRRRAWKHWRERETYIRDLSPQEIDRRYDAALREIRARRHQGVA